MASPRRAPVVTGELMPPDDVIRADQLEAGRYMATLPEPDPEPPAIDEPDDMALASVIAELGASSSDAKVNIYQVDKTGRAFVGKYIPAEFSLERVQQEYGPGDYEVRVYGVKGLISRRVIKIASPKIAAPGAAIPAVDNSKLIESMNAGFAQLGQLFANALGQMATNQPKPKTTMEMLQEMQMMRDIMGMNAAPAGPDPMRLFEMATEIAEKIHPREGEPGTGEIILKALENFGPLLTKAGNQPAQLPAPNPSIPATIRPNPMPAPQPDQSPAQEPDQMSIARKLYLNLLLSNAANDNDTMTYANLMLDVAGEDAAVEFANKPDWYETLCKEEPRAAQFPEWFRRLRDDVLELTKPENETIDTGTPTP